MRLVVDTNTVLSGLLWRGAPSLLINAAMKREITLCCSVALLDELNGVIQLGKFNQQLAARNVDATTLVDGYSALVEILIPANITSKILRDSTDDMVLACAIAARADFIVSGDAHLLDWKQYHGIPIVTAAIFMQQHLAK